MNIDADATIIENTVKSAEEPVAIKPMPQNIWMHGLTVVILLILSNLAMTLTAASGIVQFFWMLIAKERNEQIQRFGDGLAHWLGKAVAFVTANSEVKPFPWTDWKA